MNAELLKMLLGWAKQELAEKLAPKKPEKSPESLALEKVRKILDSYVPRFGDTAALREVFDEIGAVLNEVEGISDAPLSHRDPYQVNKLTEAYISSFIKPVTGKKWVWPGICAASDLWYTKLPGSAELLQFFAAIPYFSPGQKGDVVVFDNRIGNGYGGTGLLIEDCGSTVRVYMDDGASLQYRRMGKAAVLGYLRPKVYQK